MNTDTGLTIPQWFLMVAAFFAPLVTAVLIPYLRGVSKRQEEGNRQLASIDRHLGEVKLELRHVRGRVNGLSKRHRETSECLTETREEVIAIKTKLASQAGKDPPHRA